MKTVWGSIWRGLVLVGAFVLAAGASGQDAGAGQQKQAPPSQQQTPPTQQQPSSPLDVGAPAAPVASPEEDAAFQAFSKMPSGPQKIEAGEAFVQKYPQSHYLPSVYSALVIEYFISNQLEKTVETGKKAIEINPGNPTILAITAQVMVRTWRPNASDSAANLDAAEQYSKKALEALAAAPKPAGVSDEAFNQTKSRGVSMAHSSLGTVDLHRKDYSDAITELQAAVSVTTRPDPVDYYLLGLAEQNSAHYDDAAAAYGKCAETVGGMQTRCKSMQEEAKKLATTQLSAPK
jgi:tetratricopeptide (TPR) repeat protein